MNYAFKVTCDDCAVKFSFGEGRFGAHFDLTPQTARALAQDLMEAAQNCEDAQEHELEQMA
jgi:hypothetical protein